MNREELIAYDKWLTRRKWGTGEIISPERAADIYLAEHPLPPAEGAEAIVKKYEDEYDFKFHWVQRDRVIRMMREFAAQQQPTAEGAEKLSAKKYLADNGYGSGFNYTTNQVAYLMQEFTTLHAQRIADKMVEERSEFIKKAVIRFFYTEVDLNFCTREYRDRVEWYFNTYQHEIFKLPKTSLDNFKSRYK